MLSTTTEYALRIMIALTESSADSLTSAQIARATGVPTDYTVKVLQMLARANLLEAQRGRGGGFRLICDPQQTTLLDVVRAIEPLERIHACPLGLEAHRDEFCPLHRCIESAQVQLENGLRAMTLQAVVDNAPGSALCRRPTEDEPGQGEAGSPRHDDRERASDRHARDVVVARQGRSPQP